MAHHTPAQVGGVVGGAWLQVGNNVGLLLPDTASAG